jgi:membrane protease YdiL (CAAX protease family)
MNLILSSVTTAITNFVVFSIIPFIWWFIRHRKKEGFFKWIGIYKPQLKSKWWVLIVFGVIYYFSYSFDFTQLLDKSTLEYIENNSSVSANAFAGIGAMAILPALIENFIANGLSEEILFRGFLNKRLCNKFGTVKGIITQAVLFGLMHNMMYILAGLDVGLWYHILVFAFTGVGALLLGWLNEKIFNGSIIPSILLHGAGNFIASMLVAFA